MNKLVARISTADDDKEPAYIVDPEMTYLRQEQKTGKVIIVSLTEAIDKNLIKLIVSMHTLELNSS